MDMKLWKTKNSIGKKLSVYFVFIVLLPMVVFCVVMQSIGRNNIVQLATTTTQNSIDLIAYNIDKQFYSYECLTDFIAKDYQIKEMAEFDTENRNPAQLEHFLKIKTLLNSYRTSVDRIESVSILYANGKFFSTASDQMLKEENPQAFDWYEQCMENPSVSFVINYLPGDSILPGDKPAISEMISICRAITDKNGTAIGAINMLAYNYIMETSMSNILSRRGSYVYVVSDNDNVIYSPIVQEIPEVDDKNYISTENYIEKLGWTVVGVMPLTQYTQQISSINRIMVIALVLLTLLVGAFSFWLGASIIQPLEFLQQLMKKAEGGDLSVRFSRKAPVEVMALGDSFNRMIQKLDGLMNQIYMEQKAKRKAEVAALQAYIKPHFLYNTLDTIHWMAKAYHAEDIVETIDMLSTLFRVSLSKGSDVIPLEQELLHVRSYLQIQKVRYEDLIDYTIHIASDCKMLYVPKLMLQPLVENSIYHGIKPKGVCGLIELNAWRNEDSLFISVEDNGAGMSEQRLKVVTDSLQSFVPQKDGAYGVVNVHQRISLNYGAPYGMMIRSEQDIGTTIVLRLPILLEEKHDKGTDS